MVGFLYSPHPVSVSLVAAVAGLALTGCSKAQGDAKSPHSSSAGQPKVKVSVGIPDIPLTVHFYTATEQIVATADARWSFPGGEIKGPTLEILRISLAQRSIQLPMKFRFDLALVLHSKDLPFVRSYSLRDGQVTELEATIGKGRLRMVMDVPVRQLRDLLDNSARKQAPNAPPALDIHANSVTLSMMFFTPEDFTSHAAKADSVDYGKALSGQQPGAQQLLGEGFFKNGSSILPDKDEYDAVKDFILHRDKAISVDQRPLAP